ncbi:hypothetical protein BOH78_0572 [Pichia kudriavzevii]|nr:hypothetical protein BOH78_0572 [Pichia kudriavzevii]
MVIDDIQPAGYLR